MQGQKNMGTAQNAAKLIIIDQSLRDFRGHHLVYDVSVAEAAKKLGWTPVIVSHADFDKSHAPKDIKVLPAFSQSWDRLRKDSRLKRIARRYSPRSLRGALSTNAKAAYVLFARSTLRGRLGPISSNPLEFLQKLSRFLMRVVRKFSLVRRLWAYLVTFLSLPFILAYRLITRRGSPAQESFANGVALALKKLEAGPQDFVFIHTIGVDDLDGLLSYMTSAARTNLPQFRILLRRDCNEELTTKATGRSLRECLNGFHRSGLYPSKAAFFTDTDQLTAQYDAQSGIKFTTAPIPIHNDLIEALEARSSKTNGDAPLNVVYLGDARPEKGYQYLPDLVEGVWESLVEPGKVRFTFQSNYNLPGGEPGIYEARLRLSQLPDDLVKLITEPMSTEDYYELLSAADIVVLPYEAHRYPARSSGALTEALAAGKPAIVPAGTWLSSQVNSARGVAFDHPRDLAGALSTVVDGYGEYRSAAQRFKAEWTRFHSPENLVATITKPAPAAHVQTAGSETPSVLFVMDADAFRHKTGSFNVARNQLQYLETRGYRVYLVLLSMDIASPNYSPATIEAETRAALSEFRFAGSWILHFGSRLSNAGSLFRALKKVASKQYSLERELDTRKGFEIPASLKVFLRNNPVDAVLMNYIINMPIVERLGLAGKTKIICEMHDIQSHQFAIYGKRDIDREEFRKECGLLDSCAAVIAINKRERDKITPYLTNAKVTFVEQPIATTPADISMLAGCRDLSEVLSAGGSDLDYVNLGTAITQGNNWQRNRLLGAGGLDLLFVSTSHAPNIQSFDWFFRNVFTGFLAPRGVNITVAGNIHWSIPQDLHPQVFLAGRQDDLSVLYSACKIVVLPIIAGAGASIKTLEAIARHKPIVATSRALGSIGLGLAGLPSYDKPEDFAAAVLDLLKSSSKRSQVADQSYRLLLETKREENYRTRMDAIFSETLGKKAQKASEAAGSAPAIQTSRDMPPLAEWTEEIGDFNQIMRNEIEGRPTSEEALEKFLAAPASSHKIFELLYQAFLETRVAPIIKTAPWIRKVVEESGQPASFEDFRANLRNRVSHTNPAATQIKVSAIGA